MNALVAPFPYFGGKRSIAHEVWERFGHVNQYVEPFCGSASVLLAAPKPAPLEVIGDANMYVANFWRAVRFQPEAVFAEVDWPVSHIDLHARHAWLTNPERRDRLAEALADPEWHGDARIAGWWAWGQCCWIGSGWCERESSPARGKIPRVADAGAGIQRVALGQIPLVANAGQADGMSAHRTGARDWIMRLSERLERVRVIHGSWERCLSHLYGGEKSTAFFLDPPYVGFEKLYAKEGAAPVAKAVEAWARDNAHLRIALCGHDGDYDLDGWECFSWHRVRGNTRGRFAERIWFSPACAKPEQKTLLGVAK